MFNGEGLKISRNNASLNNTNTRIPKKKKGHVIKCVVIGISRGRVYMRYNPDVLQV
jgi:hypothetical protein